MKLNESRLGIADAAKLRRNRGRGGRELSPELECRRLFAEKLTVTRDKGDARRRKKEKKTESMKDGGVGTRLALQRKMARFRGA